MGLVTLWHVGYSWTRDRTHISCIGRWKLDHWASMEAPPRSLFGYSTHVSHRLIHTLTVYLLFSKVSVPTAGSGHKHTSETDGIFQIVIVTVLIFSQTKQHMVLQLITHLHLRRKNHEKPNFNSSLLVTWEFWLSLWIVRHGALISICQMQICQRDQNVPHMGLVTVFSAWCIFLLKILFKVLYRPFFLSYHILHAGYNAFDYDHLFYCKWIIRFAVWLALSRLWKSFMSLYFTINE